MDICLNKEQRTKNNVNMNEVCRTSSGCLVSESSSSISSLRDSASSAMAALCLGSPGDATRRHRAVSETQ